MKEKQLYLIWGIIYILCAGLGFVRDASGFGKLLLMLAAFLFFVPGAMLLYKGIQTENPRILLRVRIISLCSLGLTLLLLIANIFSVTASETVGSVLHVLLILVSTPMFCGQYWLLSLFLWACLLMLSLKRSPKK